MSYKYEVLDRCSMVGDQQLSRRYDGLPWWLSVREPTCQCRRCKFDPWVRKVPWRRKRLLAPVFLPGKSHGQRSLVDYGPWGSQRVGHDSVWTQWMQQISLSNMHHCGHYTVTHCLNFMCQPDWAMGCPDIRETLGVYVKVFLDEMNIWISALNKADCPPQCRLLSSKSLEAWRKQKAGCGGICSLPDRLSWDSSLLLPLDRDLDHQLFWSYNLHTLDWSYTIGFRGSPACRWQISRPNHVSLQNYVNQFTYVVVFQWLSRVQLFCGPMDCSPPGSSFPGNFQARVLE